MSFSRHIFARVGPVYQEPPAKKQKRPAAQTPTGFDPLAFLDGLSQNAVESSGSGSESRPPASAATRRRVNAWLDEADLGGGDVPPNQDDQNIGDTILDEPFADDEVGDDSLNNQNTLDVIRQAISHGADADQPDPVNDVAVEEYTMKTLEAANDADAADAGFEDENVSVTDNTSHTLRASDPDIGDDTEEVIHTPQKLTMSAFQFMLSVWENEHGISRDAHTQLVEIFQLATNLADVKSTPKRKETMLGHVVKCLPLRKFRKTTIKLDYKVLPTRTKFVEDLLVFDMDDLITAIMSSPLMSGQVYRGMARLIDGPINNPWEGNWWGESIRTTSGQYFYYSDGTPIFPSDFIRWKPTPESPQVRLGRVRWFGMDFRADGRPASENYGRPLLRVQEVYYRNTLPHDMANILETSPFPRPMQDCIEFVIVEDSELSLSPEQVIERIPDVRMDYYYDPSSSRASGPLNSTYGVRLVYNQSRRQFRVVKLTSPLRGELELETYGREYLTQNFAGKQMLSLPFQIFIDAFGLYRNMYRSLTGMYLITEFFPEHLRSRRSSVYPLTLGPHGSDLADVFRGLFHTLSLDRGRELTIDGESIFVCAFMSCITGDLPSQQKLSGCQGPTANMPCRYCIVSDKNKANLSFDIINNGRYHYQTLIARKECEDLARSASNEKTRLNSIGLHENKLLFNTLTHLYPALDVIRSRPADAAHSEYQGLSRLMHNMIFKDGMSVLMPSATDEACSVYQTFAVPPGWGRLQSPKRHLDSWRMQELARGIVILPFVLRCWLKEHHIKNECRLIIKQIGREYLDHGNFSVPTVNFTAVDWVVAAVWTFTRSVITLFGRESAVDATNLSGIIIAGRRAIQFFCQVNANISRHKSIVRQANKDKSASRISALRPRNAMVRTLGAPSSIAGDDQEESDVASMTNATEATSKRRQANPEDKCNSFINMKGLPNIHGGLHLPEVVREYGSCWLVWTLLGEDKHR
ncbi:hypothetical protein ABKA04_002919 [Annulohypoxylon sp. FPYF3050]